MIESIVRNVAETAGYTRILELDPDVITAMKNTPRHKFVPNSMKRFAYENRPLPIGHGQTISQPFIVAIMSHMMDPKPGDVVLEIGTGSGYQSAILSSLVDKVYTIEIVPELAASASRVLEQLHFDNVFVRSGDGYKGWPEKAPFDSIIVTAGGNVPPKLLEQLKLGGRMIIPVQNEDSSQDLTLFEKIAEGQLIQRSILPVIFVPLIEGK
jgi:protein-L-isoaspartate(D-aspartate) O-methyltransferase